MRALVVDDNKNSAIIISDILHRICGNTGSTIIDVAYSFKEALTYKNNYYDALIIDKYLEEGKTGDEFVKEYKEIHKDCDITIFTANENKLPIEERLLNKTIGIEDLKKHLESVVKSIKEKDSMQNADVNDITNKIEDNLLDKVYAHVCSKECKSMFDDRYVMKVDFAKYIDDQHKEQKSNRKWLITTCISIAIFTVGHFLLSIEQRVKYQENVNSIGVRSSAIEQRLCTVENTISSQNTSLALITQQLEYLRGIINKAFQK